MMKVSWQLQWPILAPHLEGRSFSSPENPASTLSPLAHLSPPTNKQTWLACHIHQVCLTRDPDMGSEVSPTTGQCFHASWSVWMFSWIEGRSTVLTWVSKGSIIQKGLKSTVGNEWFQSCFLFSRQTTILPLPLPLTLPPSKLPPDVFWWSSSPHMGFGDSFWKDILSVPMSAHWNVQATKGRSGNRSGHQDIVLSPPISALQMSAP